MFINFVSSYTLFIDFVSATRLTKKKLYIGVGTRALN